MSYLPRSVCLVIVVLCIVSIGAAVECPTGDISGNCVVDMGDLVMLADDWLGVPDCSVDICADLTDDNFVNNDDLAVLAGTWGTRIPLPLTIIPDMPFTDGYYVTGSSSISLHGKADPFDTQTVRVNGRLTSYSAADGTWKIGPRGQSTGTEILLASGSQWYYLDDGSNQHSPADGAAWYGHLDYDYSAWKGPVPAKFGYGKDGEITEVSYGTDSKNKYITTYFRTTFKVEDASKYSKLTARVIRDDGAAIYLNGNPIPIVRDRISTEPFDYRTEADDPAVGDSDETTFFEHAVDPALLVDGTNTVAAEVHQCTPTSSDLGFDLELVGATPPSPSIEPITLGVGANRITAQSFADPDGTDQLLQSTYVDVRLDPAIITTISGTLTANTVLYASVQPITVTGDVVIPAGITLEIKAGVVLNFANGAGITVNSGGKLIAEGTEQDHVLMQPDPVAGATRWDGIRLDHTLEYNRFIYVDMQYGDGQGDSVIVSYSRVLMNYVTFTSTGNATPYMEVTHPRAVIRNCVFPSISGTEPLHGSGLSGDEYLVFHGCTFGMSTGYNDILDFAGGKRPGPIIQMYNNFFAGGGDDGLDFDGTDGHVEGNIFLSFANGRNGDTNNTTANAVATDVGSDIVLVRNVFVGGEHHVLLKNGVSITAQNNTFVGATMASFTFGEPGRGTDPGAGAYLENNIFWNNARVFYNIFDNPLYPGYGPDPMPSVYNTIVPSQWHYLGTGNIDADPLFTNPAGDDYSLQPISPAIGTGINGLDVGAAVPPGAWVAGEPAVITDSTEASLTVAGPGIRYYKYRLVDNETRGNWSQETTLPINGGDVGTIHLTGLQDGHTYRVEVLGKNSAGLWQGQDFGNETGFIIPGNPEGNSSAQWTVDITP
jgi:hypothetical protein